MPVEAEIGSVLGSEGGPKQPPQRRDVKHLPVYVFAVPTPVAVGTQTSASEALYGELRHLCPVKVFVAFTTDAAAASAANA